MNLCNTCTNSNLCYDNAGKLIEYCQQYSEDKYRVAKLNISNDYGEIIYADTDSFKKISSIRKIINRIKQCPHLCCFCKYSTICEISWWKRGKIDARKICNCFRKGRDY